MHAMKLLAGEIDRVHGEYDALLAVLGRVAAGEIDPARLRVDLQARTWRVELPAALPPAVAERLARAANGRAHEAPAEDVP